MSRYILQNRQNDAGLTAYELTELTLDETLKLENGTLGVNTANEAQQDNTRPITSAAVYAQLGGIEALLAAL